MILNPIFQKFTENSPLSVMARGLIERFYHPERLDQFFEDVSQRQYTRSLLFSSVFGMMNQVVFNIQPTIGAAYQQVGFESVGVSLTSVYNKLNGLELEISSELVRSSAEQGRTLVEKFGGQPKPWLPGYDVRVVDGNNIEASEHRLGVLRNVASAALPGKSLVVYDPEPGIVTDVFPCQDGHAQERSLLKSVLRSVKKNELWIADRNFCVNSFIFGIVDAGGSLLIREHKGLAWEEAGPMQKAIHINGGKVSEQKIKITNAQGERLQLRRIRVQLDNPTRDGEQVIHLLTNLPKKVAGAKKIAKLYRRRWRIETAFQELEKNLHSELNTMGYPKAALFGFCTALAAYNTMAVILAAMRHTRGAKAVEEEVSSYYMAIELRNVYDGMMIAISPEQWEFFRDISDREMADFMLDAAGNINYDRLKKHRRGPKIKKVKPPWDPKKPHVSTAKLLGIC